MNLVIDIGNTRLKAAAFEGSTLKHSEAFASVDEFLVSDYLSKYSFSHCIIGSVVDDIDALVAVLKSRMPVLLFSSETPLPIKNSYRSAATLGSDRLAAAIGANEIAPGQDILVIDAGTCIKYNYVNAANEYIGGAISPGLKMRFRALHSFTSRLPLLEADEGFGSLIGNDTSQSILGGVQLGAAAEVNGFVEQYSERFNNIKVFLTGGDADFFAKRLKKPIFADQFLILKGLNRILEHNKQKYKEAI
ncbi:MAG TPA: type III pantothenate kinase [Bacteroidia bacterium]|jgi:type III pantothenate kinase